MKKQLLEKFEQFNLKTKIKAEQEFKKYRVVQDENFISDFDKEIKLITGEKDG